MEQFSAWHEKTGTVIRPVQAVSEDICIRTVRPRRIVNCLIAPPRNILTYLPFESLGAVSYSPSIVTMALPCISSEWSSVLVENRYFFHTPLAFDALVRGSLSEYWHPVWYGKTRMVGLPDGEKTLRISVTAFRLNSGVWLTDRRTDIFPRHSPRCAYASCDKNESILNVNTIRKLYLMVMASCCPGSMLERHLVFCNWMSGRSNSSTTSNCATDKPKYRWKRAGSSRSSWIRWR